MQGWEELIYNKDPKKYRRDNEEEANAMNGVEIEGN